jgi:regulator of RNase E activity RraA
VIVVNAGGYLRTAVWGEILHTCAEMRGVAGVIIDGAIRDRAVLEKSSIPIFACGSAPNGPHKGWGGAINDVIECGGIAVCPNDLIVADPDGIVVVPRRQVSGLLERCKQRMAHESRVLVKIRSGVSSIEALDIKAVVDEPADQ